MNLITANKLTLLLDKLAERITYPAKNSSNVDPLKPEVIVVQSQAMAQYLKVSLARKMGIAANIKFPFSFHLINDFKKELTWPEENLFHPNYSRWILTSLIKDLSQKVELDHPLSQFSGNTKTKDIKTNSSTDEEKILNTEIYKFGFQMAYQFDQYDFFRSKELGEWETNPNNLFWQAKLWKLLRKKIDSLAKIKSLPSYTRREEIIQITQKIISSDFSSHANNFPERISIFGISHLPQVFIEFIISISSKIKVDFYRLDVVGNFINPTYKESKNEGYFYRGINQSSLEFANKLSNLIKSGNIKVIDFASSQVKNTNNYWMGKIPLLDLVEIMVYQKEEKQLVLKNEVLIRMREPKNYFFDLQIHNCPSLLREVEVLKNNLLAWIEKYASENKKISLNDILVMAPNIDSYLPLIQTVFSEPPYLHHSVVDQALKHELILFEEVNLIISLFASQFEASKFFAILDCKGIQRNWNLELVEVKTIKKWLQNAGYRWGRDNYDRGEKHDGFTLKRCLEKLCYSFFIDPNNINQLKKLAQLQLDFNFSRDDENTLGKLLSLTESLFYFDKKFNHSAKITEWTKRFRNLINRFFFNKKKNSYTDLENILNERNAIFNKLTQLDEQVEITEHHELIKLNTFLWIFKQEFLETNPYGYLVGGITFSSIKPMRTLPFKTVALLGMGTEFPRSDKYLSFNLLENYRAGDRSIKKDDELMFLETILSCRDFLHISYLGFSPENHSELPLSTLVSNLIFTLAQFLQIKPAKFRSLITQVHPLRGSNKSEFQNNKKFFFYNNYAKKDYQIVIGDRLYPKKTLPWLNLLKQYLTKNYKDESKEKTITDLNLKRKDIFTKKINNLISKAPIQQYEFNNYGSIKKLFKNSSEFFVRQILKIELSPEEEMVDEEEKFILDPLDKYKIYSQYFETNDPTPSSNKKIFSNFSALELEQLIKQDLLSTGILGNAELNKFKDKVDPMAQRIIAIINVIDNKNHERLLNKMVSEVKNFATHKYGIWENWTFDLDRKTLNLTQETNKYLFVSIDNLYQGYRVYHRYYNLKFYDILYFWIDHLLLSLFTTYRGTIVPINPLKESQLLFLPRLSETKEELKIIGKMIALGKHIPFPLFPGSGTKLLTQLKKGMGENEVLKLIENAAKEWPENEYTEFCFPENPLEKYPSMVRDFYFYLFSTYLDNVIPTTKVKLNTLL